MKLIRRGDIWLVNFRPDGREGEAGQIHPGIIFTNNLANANTHLLMVIPLTSNVKRVYVTNIVLPNQRTGLDYDSKVQVEAMRAANVSRLIKRIGFVPDDLMQEVNRLVMQHLALT